MSTGQSTTASGETRTRLLHGARVEINWGKHGWLPATFENYSSPDDGEDFERIKAMMDNGWACWGSGYHPDCVRSLK